MDLEGSTLALWAELLEDYFDGAEHTVGILTDVPFPVADITFQEKALPQPMQSAVGISIVWVAPSHVKVQWDTLTPAEIDALPDDMEVPPTTQQRATADCSWLFLVRSVATAGNKSAQKQVQQAAGALYGLLSNAGALAPLAQKGIHHIRPNTPRMSYPGDGAPSADLSYRLRVIACRGQLRWPILSQEPDGVSGDGVTSDDSRITGDGDLVTADN